MHPTSISGRVDLERDLGVDGVVVLDDAVIPVPEDERGDDGTGVNETR